MLPHLHRHYLDMITDVLAAVFQHHAAGISGDSRAWQHLNSALHVTPTSCAQVKTVLSTLLRNFELELVDPFPQPDFDSMVVGPKPCRVRYRRRQLVAK